MRLQILRNPVIPTSAFCILVLTLTGPASAQSFFNSGGLGEVTPSGDARIAALAEPSALSMLNPGIFVGLDKTSFHVTALAAAVVGTQGDNSRLLRDARPAAFNVAAPLPFQTRLFGGINQKFGQDFDVWSESLPDTAYRRHIVGRGGIYTLRAGLAKSLFDRVCVGVEYGRIAGGSRERWRFELENGSYTSTDTIEVDYAGNTFKVGGSFQSRLFSMAAYYEPPQSLNAQRYKRVHGVIQDTARTYSLRLPYSLSLAAALSPTSQLGVNVGLSLSPWQDATVTTENSTSDLGTKNVWRGSIGAEYNVDSLHPVRIGYSRQTWYYGSAYIGTIGAADINENAVHLGTSVPIPKFGSLDISGELLFSSSHTLKETAGRLMLTLAYAEAWMKRTRRWGY
jgi:hypothetical protein